MIALGRDAREDAINALLWVATQRFIKQHTYYLNALFNPSCLCDECKAVQAAETNFLPHWGL